MDDAKRELIRSWLTKAAHDLAAARKLAAEPDPVLDAAIYHCQQAGEKVVKGFLAFSDELPARTHDIRLLVTLAGTYEPQFSAWLPLGARLTRYATQFRYPGGMMGPDRAEFDQALQDAEALYGFVCSLLPAEVQP